MLLYFQSGKKRIAINTDSKAYNRNYSYLGGWKEYIKVSDAGYRELVAACVRDGYKEVSCDNANEEVIKW